MNLELGVLRQLLGDICLWRCVGRCSRCDRYRGRSGFGQLCLAREVFLDDDAAGGALARLGLLMTAFGAGHMRCGRVHGLLGFGFGWHQAQAGGLIQLLAHLGPRLLQSIEVLLRLAFTQITLERHRRSAEQTVDTGKVALEQTGQVCLDHFQRCLGHQLAVEHDLVARLIHASFLVGGKWGERAPVEQQARHKPRVPRGQYTSGLKRRSWLLFSCYLLCSSGRPVGRGVVDVFR